MTKKRLYQILEKGSQEDKLSRNVDAFIMFLILLNVASVILESVPDIYLEYKFYFLAIENVSLFIFIFEYALRLYAITENPKYTDPVWGRLRYIVSIVSIIDLMAIIPGAIIFFGKINGSFLRGLTILRMFRIMKIARYSTTFKVVQNVIYQKRRELMVSLFMVGALLVFSSCMMYFVEHDNQPEAFSSIPATMWWGVATLTTVGYGDIYPITPMGKFLGGIMAILGVGLFALPAGILANGFGDALSNKGTKNICKKCNCEIDKK